MVRTVTRVYSFLLKLQYLTNLAITVGYLVIAGARLVATHWRNRDEFAAA